MPDPIIEVEHLSKLYELGAIGGRTLRESLERRWHTLRGKEHLTQKVGARHASVGPDHPQAGPRPNTIWALRDASFTVQAGEVLGIIGRNGAGKSTLLKLLTRITEPTSGRAFVYGRAASLLEVGTGFHPELTGRENIYLSGAILGMKKAEISRRFDEIVAFSEVEQFIDTPVKRYSSGMYVRLAFAVAAHLDPEILLVDEVLAVGDAAFQKKCLGKMGDVAGEGRTILFVSHNLQAVRTLCPKSILIDAGQVAMDAPTDQTLDLYNRRQREVKVDADTAMHSEKHRRGSGAVRFTHIAVQDERGSDRYDVEVGGIIRLVMSYKVMKDIPDLLVSVALRSGNTGEIVTTARHVISPASVRAQTEGSVTIDFPDIRIRPGTYPLYFWLGNSDAQPFDVVDDITAPLVVTAGGSADGLGLDASAPVGYFSIPSVLRSSQGSTQGGQH
ncbi:MAG TPA: ABC transporter ATP-binding protein [bacterium]|nr:ABC transporter ATP-binding protein [bacterium]